MVKYNLTVVKCHVDTTVAKLINRRTTFILKIDTSFSLSILSIPVHPYSKIVGKMVHEGYKGGQVQFIYIVSVISF